MGARAHLTAKLHTPSSWIQPFAAQCAPTEITIQGAASHPAEAVPLAATDTGHRGRGRAASFDRRRLLVRVCCTQIDSTATVFKRYQGKPVQ